MQIIPAEIILDAEDIKNAIMYYVKTIHYPKSEVKLDFSKISSELKVTGVIDPPAGIRIPGCLGG